MREACIVKKLRSEMKKGANGEDDGSIDIDVAWDELNAMDEGAALTARPPAPPEEGVATEATAPVELGEADLEEPECDVLDQTRKIAAFELSEVLARAMADEEMRSTPRPDGAQGKPLPPRAVRNNK